VKDTPHQDQTVRPNVKRPSILDIKPIKYLQL
jgi:hypothetical protein